jgi:alanine-alpha-ketoisovalerate/valine-pyruvate aminotransferase
LLVPKTIALQEKTNKQVLDGLWVVDEEKLAALSEVQIVELHRNGYLAAIHAHLISLNNVGRLAEPVTVTATAVTTLTTAASNAAVEKNSEPVHKPDSAKKVKTGTH